MPIYYYYDTRDINGVETQFFHESRTKVADKEFQTNMELDAQFARPFRLRKILVFIPPVLTKTDTSGDATVDDNIQTLAKEGVIELQIGTGRVYYFPVALALVSIKLKGDIEFAQGTAADASYALLTIDKGEGLDVEIDIPAREDFKFFIRTKTSITISGVKVVLVGEE